MAISILGFSIDSSVIVAAVLGLFIIVVVSVRNEIQAKADYDGIVAEGPPKPRRSTDTSPVENLIASHGMNAGMVESETPFDEPKSRRFRRIFDKCVHFSYAKRLRHEWPPHCPRFDTDNSNSLEIEVCVCLVAISPLLHNQRPPRRSRGAQQQLALGRPTLPQPHPGAEQAFRGGWPSG